MSKVNWLNGKHLPSWHDVLIRIQEAKDSPGDESVSLSIDEEDDDYLIAYFTEHGFLIEVHGGGEADFYSLTQHSPDAEIVNAWCAGDTVARPRRFFVSESIATQAIKHYFDKGTKDESLAWEVKNYL